MNCCREKAALLNNACEIAFADPDARLGYAHIMNKMDFYVSDDPREKPLGDALYRAIARLTDRPDRRDDAHLTSGLCKWRLCRHIGCNPLAGELRR